MEQTEYQQRLEKIRKEIDSIDGELLPLFLKRMACSEEVARLKQEAGAPVFNASREQEILQRVREKGGGYGGSAAALYSTIMSISRARQHQILTGGKELREVEKTAAREMPEKGIRVFCQGVSGAYSHKAALAFFREPEIEFRVSWKEVFEEVKKGSSGFGVLPVENSAAGSVSGVYDLLLQYRFYITGAVDVRVEHCLAAPKAEKITSVVSHPQGLSQCSEYIEAHSLQQMEFSNTAAAAKYVAENVPLHTAAICSREAAKKYGLQILEENIQNARNNVTRFVVISREPILPREASKISLCFSLPHTTGSLYSVLERFAIGGLNLTKIESRPIPESNFEYDFYLDFTGNIHDPETLELICSLHDELPRFSFLGNYREISSEKS